MRFSLTLALALAIGACARTRPAKRLDLDAIKVPGTARMRTDMVGAREYTGPDSAATAAKFDSVATFVLVDAENTAAEGAYVTLGGELTDGTTVVGQLKPQSLWIPAHEARMFALVDTERVPRPAAKSARIKVTGTLVPDDPPRARIEELHSYDDYGKTVVQAMLVNDADRIGQIMVIASFHDVDGQPMTRPFQLIQIDRKQKRPVQFVGPQGSTRGAIYVGDVIY